jgi:hypothetical protein
MAARHFVLVHHNGETERLTHHNGGGHGFPEVIVKGYAGDVEKYFVRAGYAVAWTGSERPDAEGTLVWIERPKAVALGLRRTVTLALRS